MLKSKVGQAKNVIENVPLSREPSVIISPIKHEILSTSKHNRKNLERKKE